MKSRWSSLIELPARAAGGLALCVLLAAAPVFVCAATGFVEGLESDGKGADACYIAPCGALMYRMMQSDGVVREFARDSRKPRLLVGGGGWSGSVRDDRIEIFSDSDAGARLSFRGGRLVKITKNGRSRKFDVSPPKPPHVGLGSLWPDAQVEEGRHGFNFDIWRKSGRLRLWFVNPNRAGAFFAEILVLFVALSFFAWPRRRVLALVASVGALASFACVLFTGSRSSFLAALSAVAIVVLFEFRRSITPRRVLLLLVGLAIGLGMVYASPKSRRLTSRLFAMDRSNKVRLRNLAIAPRMMKDAPGGWGFVGAGKAYRSWYQPFDSKSVPITLVSDHVTNIVELGNPARVAYLAFWIGIIGITGLAAFRGKSSVPLSLWTVLALSGAFNRTLGAQSLWLAPVVSALCLCRRPSRGGLIRAGAVLAASVLVSVAALAAVLMAGDTPKGELRVRADDSRVLLNGTHPDIWIADDGWVFGGGMAAMELRASLLSDGSRCSLGYVRSPLDLPGRGVRRLVLGGKTGLEFLMALSDGRFPDDFQVPPEIVFVSPEFPPSVVPEIMLLNSKVRLFIGEFAAAQVPEYANPPSWVTIVPGVELYIPKWTSLVRGEGV